MEQAQMEYCPVLFRQIELLWFEPVIAHSNTELHRWRGGASQKAN